MGENEKVEGENMDQVATGTQTKQEKYWYVYCPSGGRPKAKHYSLESAQRRADMLAEQNHGFEFRILELVETRLVVDAEPEEQPADEGAAL